MDSSDEKQMGNKISDAELATTVSIAAGDANDFGDQAAIAKKDIGPLTLLALAFNICNCWAGIAGTMALSVATGGAASLLYGMILTTIAYGCIAATLAELSSVYPTAGGQYHFTSILAPKSVSRFMSYLCGVTSVFSWVAIGASVTIFPALQILAMVINYNPDFTPKSWHYFLIFQSVNLLVVLNNIFLLKRTTWTHSIGFFLTIFTFFVVIFTSVGRSTSKQSNEFVWGTFFNLTGWPDGIAFLYSLLSPCFMYAGLDGALHVAEECPNPKRTVPIVVVTTIGVGFVTAFSFVIIMAYFITDFSAVLATDTGFPIYELYMQSFHSDTAATTLVAAGTAMTWFTLNAIHQTSSRLIWSFARDNGLIFSRHIVQINTSLDVPVWAIAGNGIVIMMSGCIYLASSTAFNALIGSAVVLQQLSFLFPTVLLVYRRRCEAVLPKNRSFRLFNGIGWAVNLFAIAFITVLTIIFMLPSSLPVTTSNMNYTVVILAIATVLSLANWLFHAKAHYNGPRIQLQSLE